MKDLKERTISGGIVRFAAQAASFSLRLVSVMILARLLGPKEFGLVGMVTAFTGVLELCREFGLSAVTIQRETITDAQVSTLFWTNVAFGVMLSLIMVGLSPEVAHFYHEPKLTAVTCVLALGLLFNAAGVQHSALLGRAMRYTVLAVINVGALLAGTLVGIGGAIAGFGYWSLVAMSITMPFTMTVGFWMASGWIPGWPRRGTGIRSMMRFGGTLTATGLLSYLANNLDKVLIGRYWGSAATGLYGRAYQLINIPTANLNSAAGDVAFSALSRLQDDPARRRSYFLKGFSLVLGLTLPVTIGCEFFAHDVILVLLGPKWMSAVPVFIWLAPSILICAVANPLSWLLTSAGMVGRQMRMTLVIAPLMIVGYFIGLPYGPVGVACAYSVVLSVWTFPFIAWATHGTEVTFWDILKTVWPPLASSLVAGVFAFAGGRIIGSSLSALMRLILETAILLSVFACCLMTGATQRALYLNLLRTTLRFLPGRDKQPVSAY